MHPGMGQLRPNQNCQDAGNTEKTECCNKVHYSDSLMIGCRKPRKQAVINKGICLRVERELHGTQGIAPLVVAENQLCWIVQETNSWGVTTRTVNRTASARDGDRKTHRIHREKCRVWWA